METPTFRLLYWFNELPQSRFTVRVPISLDTRSVKRNRIKRLIHESLSHLLYHVAAGYDIVIQAKKIITGAKQGDIEVEIQNILHQANLIKDQR